MKTRFHGVQLLYLDFDGVLQPEDVYRLPQIGPSLGWTAQARHRMFEHAELLTELQAPHPTSTDAMSSSYLSSSMKEMYPLSGRLELLRRIG